MYLKRREDVEMQESQERGECREHREFEGRQGDRSETGR
jgi:hypothetical protein